MISAIILTLNEESRIKACLESIKWVDEIIIVDSGSKDNTLEIAKKYTDKIIKSTENEDFAQRRNLGAKEAKGNWLLYLDADERILEALKEEINEITQSNTNSAFAISRKNVVFGKEVNYGPFWPDWVIRLLRKEDFESWVGKVHESPKFKGSLGYTKNSLLHLTHRSLDHIVLKSLEWSNIDAKLRLEADHPKMSGWRFLRIFITEIFNQGIKRKGFFSGEIGIMDSLLQTFSMYMTYVRLWEMQQKKPLEEVYDDIDKALLENNFKN